MKLCLSEEEKRIREQFGVVMGCVSQSHTVSPQVSVWLNRKATWLALFLWPLFPPLSR